MHDQAVLLVPALLVAALVLRIRLHLMDALAGLLLGAVVLAPFIWHELTHELVNLRAMLAQVLLGIEVEAAADGHSPVTQLAAALTGLSRLIPEPAPLAVLFLD